MDVPYDDMHHILWTQKLHLPRVCSVQVSSPPSAPGYHEVPTHWGDKIQPADARRLLGDLATGPQFAGATMQIFGANRLDQKTGRPR